MSRLGRERERARGKNRGCEKEEGMVKRCKEREQGRRGGHRGR